MADTGGVIADDWFLLGAPWDCSGTGRGEQAAPAALRAAGLPALVGLDLGDTATVIDSTSAIEPTGVLALPETVRAARALAAPLDGALRDLPGRRPLVVGGDCSILLGILPALRARSARSACGSWTGTRTTSTGRRRTPARRPTWTSLC